MVNIISMLLGGLFFLIIGLKMFFSAISSIMSGQTVNMIDLSGLLLVIFGTAALILARQAHQGYKENLQSAARKNIQ